MADNTIRNGTADMLFTGEVKAYYGQENGGAVATWYEFYGLSMEVNDRQETEDVQPAGHRVATGVSYGKASADITLQGKATVGELAAFLGTGVAKTAPAPVTFSMFYGSAQGGFIYSGCTVTGWNIEQDENGINLTVNLTGGKGVWGDAPKNSGNAPGYIDDGDVIMRGREYVKNDNYGTKILCGKTGDTEAEQGDWYSWGLEVSNLTQNVYWGYAIVPSASGSGVMDGAFSLNWDANRNNIEEQSMTQDPQEWHIINKTAFGGKAYTVQIIFKCQCIENQGYTDEQEIVRSFQSSHKVIEGSFGFSSHIPVTSGGTDIIAIDVNEETI